MTHSYSFNTLLIQSASIAPRTRRRPRLRLGVGRRRLRAPPPPPPRSRRRRVVFQPRQREPRVRLDTSPHDQSPLSRHRQRAIVSLERHPPRLRPLSSVARLAAPGLANASSPASSFVDDANPPRNRAATVGIDRVLGRGVATNDSESIVVHGERIVVADATSNRNHHRHHRHRSRRHDRSERATASTARSERATFSFARSRVRERRIARASASIARRAWTRIGWRAIHRIQTDRRTYHESTD